MSGTSELEAGPGLGRAITQQKSRSHPARVGAAPARYEPHQIHATLSGWYLGDQSLTQILTEIAVLAGHVIPAAQDVSITVLEHDRPRAVVFAGALASALDERQYGEEFGPCVPAARTGAVIEIGDTTHDSSYDRSSVLARRHDVRAVLAIALAPRQHISAALGFYLGASACPVPGEIRGDALSFAADAGATVMNAALYEAQRSGIEHLRSAMDSRAAIEQAKGIIMREGRCSADEAFALMCLRSSREHRKVRDIAVTIVQNAAGGG